MASLQRVKFPIPLNKCPGYATKPSDGEAPVLECWGMWSTLSLLLIQGPFRLKVVVLVRVSSIGQIELFNHLAVCKQMTNLKLNCSCYIAILEPI